MKLNLQYLKDHSKALIAIGLLALTALAYFLVDSRLFQGLNKLQSNNLDQCIDTTVNLEDPSAIATNSLYKFKVRENCNDVEFAVLETAGTLYGLELTSTSDAENPNDIELSVNTNFEEAILVWDFDDGNTAIDQTTINHTFDRAGEYLVTVRATQMVKNQEITLNAQKTVVIENDKEFEIPEEPADELDFQKEIVPRFEVSLKDTTDEAAIFNFTDLSSPQENIMNWNWDFGDGTAPVSYQKDSEEAATASSFGLEHNFNFDFESTTKDFVVTLTVFNENGERFETNQIVKVEKPEKGVEEVKDEVKSAFNGTFLASVLSANSGSVQRLNLSGGSDVALLTWENQIPEALEISANGESMVFDVGGDLGDVPEGGVGQFQQQEEQVEEPEEENFGVNDDDFRAVCGEVALAEQQEYLNLLLQKVVEDSDVVGILPPKVAEQMQIEFQQIVENLQSIQETMNLLQRFLSLLEEVLTEDAEAINQFLSQLLAEFELEIDVNQILPFVRAFRASVDAYQDQFAGMSELIEDEEALNTWLKERIIYTLQTQVAPNSTTEEFLASLMNAEFTGFDSLDGEKLAILTVAGVEHPTKIYEYLECQFFLDGVLIGDSIFSEDLFASLLENKNLIDSILNDYINYLKDYKTGPDVCQLVGSFTTKTHEVAKKVFTKAEIPDLFYQKLVVNEDQTEFPSPRSFNPGIVDIITVVATKNTLVEQGDNFLYQKDVLESGEDLGFFALQYGESQEFTLGDELLGQKNKDVSDLEFSNELPGFALYCFELSASVERGEPKPKPETTTADQPKEDSKPTGEVTDDSKPTTTTTEEEKPKVERGTAEETSTNEETKNNSQTSSSTGGGDRGTSSNSGGSSTPSAPTAATEVEITSVAEGEYSVEQIFAANPCLKPADEDKIRTFSDLKEDYYAYDVVKLLSEITEDVEPIVIGRKGASGTDNFEGESYIFRGEGVKIIAKPGCFASIAGEKDLWDTNNQISFNDLTSQYWGYDNINGFVNLNILEGYKADNTMRPNGFMTIAEYNKLLIDAITVRKYLQENEGLDFEDFEDKDAIVAEVFGDILAKYDENPFPDVKEDDWFYDYAVLAYDLDIYQGIDGLYKGNQNATRAQAAIMTYNYFVANVRENLERSIKVQR